MAKAKPDEEGEEVEEYLGVRGADLVWLGDFDRDTQGKILLVLEAMEYQKTIIFEYGESSRVVCPFVVGISSEGNPLMRGFQLEGVSLSRKGAGWRVFQFEKMENVAEYFEFFNPDEFDFDRDYPWIYRVIKML